VEDLFEVLLLLDELVHVALAGDNAGAQTKNSGSVRWRILLKNKIFYLNCFYLETVDKLIINFVFKGIFLSLVVSTSRPIEIEIENVLSVETSF
jgi:hypothetical protein